MSKKKTIADLIKKLGIDETHTTPVKKDKYFTKIKDNIPLIEHYNYMADILHMPTTSNGNKYLLTMVDIANDEFDFQPLRTKTANAVLTAMQMIFSREYLEQPQASIITDGGTEFKNEFDKYLKENRIYHKVSLPYRHKQLANVENLNGQISRVLNGYMNKKEEETGRTFTDWDNNNVLNEMREELNKIREKKLPSKWNHVPIKIYDLETKNKFEVGDFVYRKLEIPYNALGHKQDTLKFRVGDYRWDKFQPRKITAVLPYSGVVIQEKKKNLLVNDEKVPWRYRIEGIPNVAFAESELMKAPQESASKYVVEKILNKKVKDGKLFYKVKWKGYKISEATFEPMDILIKDGLKNMIDEYEQSLKKKKKK